MSLKRLYPPISATSAGCFEYGSSARPAPLQFQQITGEIAAYIAKCSCDSSRERAKMNRVTNGSSEAFEITSPAIGVLIDRYFDVKRFSALVMKRKLAYPIAAILLTVAGYVYFRNVGTEASLSAAVKPISDFGASAHSSLRTSDEVRVPQSTATGLGRRDAQTPFLAGVRTLKELDAKVYSAGANVADALKVKSAALLLCQRSDAELDDELAHRAIGDSARAQARKSLDAFQNYRRRFCVGSENDAFGKTVSELGATDPNGDYAISTKLFQVDSNAKAVEIATTLVETSTSPDAIKNSAIFLANAKNGGWDLGKDFVQGTFFASQLSQIQEMAATLVACDFSGGCGPDGMYSWVACSSYDLCRPGISLEDVWIRTNSPDVIEAVLRTAELLRRKRENG